MASRAIDAYSSQDTDLLAKDVTKQLGAKLADAFFKNKIKEVKAQAQEAQEAAFKAQHDKKRDEMIIVKLRRDLEDSQEHCRKLENEMHTIETLATTKATSLRKAESEIERLNRRVTDLEDTINTNSAVSKLSAEVEARDQRIADLSSKSETDTKELSGQLSQLKAAYDKLEKECDELYTSSRARWRWQLAGTTVILNDKRKFERKAKAKAALLSWLSGQDEADHANAIDSMNLELELARNQLKDAADKQEALKNEASQIAESKASLEAQQSELVRIAREAAERDGKLDSFAKSSEDRAVAATKRLQALSSENQYLRWAVSQAEERVKETAAESAKLMGERDAAVAHLAERKRQLKEARTEGEELRSKLLQVEASTFTERAEWTTKLSEAERAAREGANVIHRLRQLEGELATANKHIASEGLAHERQQILVSRLMELERTFGAMLKPPAAGASPYSHALQELSHLSPTKAPPRLNELSPVLVTHPGSEAHGAAMAAAATAYASVLAPKDLSPSTLGGLQKAAAVRRPSNMTASTSLPQLMGIRSPVPALSHKPIARGNTRFAARRGVSVGEKSEVQQALEKMDMAKHREKMLPDHSVTHLRY